MKRSTEHGGATTPVGVGTLVGSAAAERRWPRPPSGRWPTLTRVRELRPSARLLATLGPPAVVLTLGLATYGAVTRLRETRELVGHTREVLEASHATRGALQDAETSQRGYLLTGDERYLAPLHRGLAALRADTARLRELTRDNPAQQRRLDALAQLVRARVAALDTGIARRRTLGADAAAALVRQGYGQAVMDSARAVLAAVDREERRLLAARQEAEARRGRVLLWVIVAGTLVTGVLALLTDALLARHAARAAADARALAEHAERLQEQAVELELQTEQLQEQQVELEAQQADLEAKTVELEAANEDLQHTAVELGERAGAEAGARARAEAASRAKSEFLAVMSHELRTPLNAIAGYVELMQLGIPVAAPDEHREYLERIQRSQRHLLGIITDVLNYGRVEAGRIAYTLRRVCVGELLDTVEPLVAPQAAPKRLAYSSAACDRAACALADPEKAAQALFNLVSNAVKFTPPGGRVTLDSATRDDHVAIRVRDTGIGIAPDQQARIFEPFVQVDQRLTRTAEGIGLGLAISRDLARGMGGDITVESTLGVGTVFTLTLPRA